MPVTEDITLPTTPLSVREARGRSSRLLTATVGLENYEYA